MIALSQYLAHPSPLATQPYRLQVIESVALCAYLSYYTQQLIPPRQQKNRIDYRSQKAWLYAPTSSITRDNITSTVDCQLSAIGRQSTCISWFHLGSSTNPCPILVSSFTLIFMLKYNILLNKPGLLFILQLCGLQTQ